MNRLTKKNQDDNFYYPNTQNPNYNNVNLIQKLGKLEDLMEKYNVKSLEELEKIISKGITYYNFIKSFWNKEGEKYD